LLSQEGMSMRRGIGLALVVACLASTAVARAQEKAPPWAVRVEPGTFLMPDHLHDYGTVGLPPAVYLAASVERAIAGPLRANVSGGASPLLGWLFGGTLRYAVLDRDTAALTAGAGLMYAPDAAFGSATFAQADATVQLKISGSFGFVAGGSLGVALNSARGLNCGIDTCKAYLARGDVVGSLRLGVGFAF
jgi:hypothetical protein